MALANVACALTSMNEQPSRKNILMIDWDLEAPGLHRFFRKLSPQGSLEATGRPQDRGAADARLEQQLGLIDLFSELEERCREAPSGTESEEFARQLMANVALSRFVVRTSIPGLSLMTAGAFNKSYAAKVNSFRWESLYERSPHLIRAFAQRLEVEYQYVLIDSRTGLSDTSGICTMLMPIILVAVFTPSSQSILGTLDLVQRATAYRRSSNDLRPLLVFPLASRIDISEEDLRDKWRRGDQFIAGSGFQPLFERLFEDAYNLKSCSLESYFNEYFIPHNSTYAYGEEIAVRSTREDKYTLKRSYLSFTTLVAKQSTPWSEFDDRVSEAEHKAGEPGGGAQFRQPSAIPRGIKGLFAYSENDGALFSQLGRQSELQRCLDLLRNEENDVIVVYGQAGSGKTSLLRAGVQYKLEQTAASGEPGALRCVYWSATGGDAAFALGAQVEKSTGIACKGDLRRLLHSKERLVIIIDQFERLQEHNPAHQPIFELISLAARQTPPTLRLIAAFRLNYYVEWMDFQARSGVRSTNIPVGLFTIESAIDVMTAILAHAPVEGAHEPTKVDDKVIGRYIREVAANGQVSAVEIALGTIALSTANETALGEEVPLREYAISGGAEAVLRAHVQRSFDPSVPRKDRAPLQRALLATLVDQDSDRAKPEGAPVETIARVASLPVGRVRIHLANLETARILQILEPDVYVLANDRLVAVLKEMAQDLTRLEQSIVDQYLRWKNRKRLRDLLRGRALDWVTANSQRFVAGPDAEERAKYLKESRQARKLRYAVGFLVVLFVVLGTLATRHFFSVSAFHQELTDSHLSPDLYDRAGQLESLTIDRTSLTDLKWLRSSVLNDFNITSPALQSLDGLDSVSGLRSLDIDLDGAPIDSLREIGTLPDLQSLILRHLGRTKKQVVPDVSGVQALKSVDLDFEGSRISALPDLAPLQDLDHLALNLKSTRISDLSGLVKLNRLRSVVLYLDGSKVDSLAPLTKLEHLESLALSLDSSQLQHLKDLSSSPASFALTLYVGSAPLTDLPDLGGIHQLRGLTLLIAGSVSKQLPDVTTLGLLQELSISLTGSNMRTLPGLGRMSGLRSLNLGLESSGVEKLPDMSPMQDLERLTLNLNTTLIQDLPDFSRLTKLVELNLFLNESRVRSLHNLNRLSKLQSLTLSIGGASIEDLGTISELDSLQKLVLYLRWSQVRDLPDLSRLTHLQTLELHLEGYWGVQVLPDLTHLRDLMELSLFLDNSQIAQLPDLSQLTQLRKITLSLERSSIQDLSPLAQVAGLEDLTLNLKYGALETLPDLTQLKHLRSVSADIRGSNIKDLKQTQKLAALRELTLDQETPSLKDLPSTVKKLHLGR